MVAIADTAGYSDDASLVERCLGGDRVAERELFRRERQRVHATLYRVLGSNREMDDLLQEAFLEVFRSLHRFRGEARLSTWIDTIAVRVAYRWIARKKHVPAPIELLADVEAHDPSPDDRANAREGLRRFYATLATLPAAQRLAFALHAIDGRSIAEVAQLVGSSAIATKVRIWRARRELERLAADDPLLREYLSAGGAP